MVKYLITNKINLIQIKIIRQDWCNYSDRTMVCSVEGFIFQNLFLLMENAFGISLCLYAIYT